MGVPFLCAARLWWQWHGEHLVRNRLQSGMTSTVCCVTTATSATDFSQAWHPHHQTSVRHAIHTYLCEHSHFSNRLQSGMTSTPCCMNTATSATDFSQAWYPHHQTSVRLDIHTIRLQSGLTSTPTDFSQAWHPHHQTSVRHAIHTIRLQSGLTSTPSDFSQAWHPHHQTSFRLDIHTIRLQSGLTSTPPSDFSQACHPYLYVWTQPLQQQTSVRHDIHTLLCEHSHVSTDFSQAWSWHPHCQKYVCAHSWMSDMLRWEQYSNGMAAVCLCFGLLSVHCHILHLVCLYPAVFSGSHWGRHQNVLYRSLSVVRLQRLLEVW